MARVIYRIAIWASAGFVVTCFWVLYAAIAPVTEPILILSAISQPILLVLHFNVGRLEEVLLANAATYALIGLLVETLRQKTKSDTIIQN